VIQISVRGNTVSFQVRVVPRSSRDSIEGEHNGALKIRLTAPPVDNRANEGLRRFLANHLNLPVSAVRIASGEMSRIKRVEIRGVTTEQIQALA
jgi:uncharacterized protein